MPTVDIDRDAAHEAAQRELNKPIYPRALADPAPDRLAGRAVVPARAQGIDTARRLVHRDGAADPLGGGRRCGRAGGAADHANQPRRRPPTVRRGRTQRRRTPRRRPSSTRPAGSGPRPSGTGCGPSRATSRRPVCSPRSPAARPANSPATRAPSFPAWHRNSPTPQRYSTTSRTASCPGRRPTTSWSRISTTGADPRRRGPARGRGAGRQ